MAKDHGARQQKKAAKQKAKRAEKRTDLIRRDSLDPTVRLQRAEKWPVVEALVGTSLWEDGIGYLMIARKEAEGRLIYAVYLVDVYCLGVKDAFWEAGTLGNFKDLVRRIEKGQPMAPISPAGLVKIIQGAVDYALFFGFHPHPDFRHAATLLVGIDPASCPQEFTFGRDGKPFYIQGSNESPERARAIAERIRDAGGHYMVEIRDPGSVGITEIEEEHDHLALPEA